MYREKLFHAAFFSLFVLFVCAGCYTKGYSGPERPDKEVSIIHHGGCVARLEVDGTSRAPFTSGVTVLPGMHKVLLFVVKKLEESCYLASCTSSPYDDNQVECEKRTRIVAQRSTCSLSLETEAGRKYNIDSPCAATEKPSINITTKGGGAVGFDGECQAFSQTETSSSTTKVTSAFEHALPAESDFGPMLYAPLSARRSYARFR